MTIDLKARIGITEIGPLTMWFRSRLGRYMTVMFDPSAPSAYVKRGPGNTLTCVIPSPNASMTIRDAIRLRGFVLHEYGHPRWQPEIFDVMDRYPTHSDSPLAGIYNIIADVHSETLTALEYPGDAKALSEFAAVVGRDVYDRLKPEFEANGSVWPPNFAKMAGLMVACRNAEATWNTGMRIGFDKLVNELYTKDIRDLSDVIETKFRLTDRLVTKGELENEWTLWDLSKDIFAFLYDADPEEQIGPPRNKGGKEKEEEEEKDGEGEGKEKKEGSSEFDKDAKGKAEPDKFLEEKIKIKELIWSDHYETEQGGGHGQGFDYTQYVKRDVYTPVDPATIKVIDFSKEKL